MDRELIIQLSYLVSAVLFIYGLKRLSKPATARGGNQLASLGMLLAVVATLIDQSILEYQWIIIGVVTGGIMGTLMARLVKMTDMPQMVAIFNGFGGAASGLVAVAEYFTYLHHVAPQPAPPLDGSISIMAGTLIGAVTLSGSLIAFGKLQGIITWFDNFSVLLRRDAHSQLVYKHAISTVMPAQPVQLFEPAKEQEVEHA